MDKIDRWLESLRARHISVSVENGTLKTSATRRNQLTDADLKFLDEVDVDLVAVRVLELREEAKHDATIRSRLTLTVKQYKAMGWIRMSNGRWCHPRGDEVGNKILDGHISIEDAIAEHQEIVEKERRSPFAEYNPPPPEDFVWKRGRYPGHWVGIREKGKNYHLEPKFEKEK